MAIIRKIEIENLRCIKSLSWVPSEGINCLIGPGDSGKSTILDAIDLCLGARRTSQIGDADFFELDVTQPISISITIGCLDDSLKNIETYGQFLRSFDALTGNVEDEPEKDGETVLTINFRVESDLEPVWSLVSDRAAQQGVSKTLTWSDRQRIAPTRLGTQAGFNLSWTRGSILNRLAEEKIAIGAALAEAAREARTTFGDQAGKQLNSALESVAKVASELGIPIGGSSQALLDAHSVSFSDGAIALHNEAGVPLRNLGTGSTRLLVAGLQRQAAESASIILIDELEYGLEPHRLIRLLGSLGAKQKSPPLQVFMTTHSPVAIRELNSNQLFVVRRKEKHEILCPGADDGIQGTMRLYPDAFLASTVIVCEGASEVGLVRGLDIYRASMDQPSLTANGVSYVDATGGDGEKCLSRAAVFLGLGYRVLALIDNDKPPSEKAINEFTTKGGKLIIWRTGRALEDELFLSLPGNSISSLLIRAIELNEENLVDDHIKSRSHGKLTLEQIKTEGLFGDFSVETREVLGKAARVPKEKGWFKSVGKMEGVARDIIGPNLENVDPDFSVLIDELFDWAHGKA